MVPTDTEVFLPSYDYVEKADFSKGYWNPKRKLGITTHSLEIINQNNKTMYGIFPKLQLNYLWKMLGYS